ncbi:MAG: efflux RND transporter permease subunit, partial [Chloroflexi bacterium]|nr:efflux RND transporter permease subunit [Chloroflexota bacterium]
GRLRRILIYVEPDQLKARDLSLMDVVNAIRSNNVLIPTGDAKIGPYDYQITSNAELPAVPDFNDIVVRVVDGKPIYIRDIGKAEDAYAIQTNQVYINGKPAVYIPIYRQPGANTIQVVDGIRAALPKIQQIVTNGKQLKLDVLVDQSIYVREAIGSLEREALLGALLAGIMVLLFLRSIRSTLIVSISLPLAVIAAFIGLYFTGETINAMTLGGIAMAMGILMDNAIVVIENINRHLHLGKSSRQAARDGAAEIATPILVATTSIMIIFAPVLFLTGMAKFLFTPLALAVIFALAASYVLSMLIVPAAAARFLAAQDAPAEQKPAAKGLLQPRYNRALDAVMQRRLAMVLVLLGLFAAVMLLVPTLGRELFPQIDAGQFTILMRAPSGVRLEKTEEYSRQVQEIVRKTIPASDLKMVVSNAGILYDWPAAYTPNAGPMDAFILVQLSPGRHRTAQEYAAALRHVLRRQVPGIQFAFDTGGMVSSALNNGLPSPIDVQVEGPNLKTSHQIAEVMRGYLEQIPGAVDVRVEQRLDYPQIDVQINQALAASVGLTASNIVQNLVSAVNSSTTFLPSFWLDKSNGNHYFVGVTYREKEIASQDTLADVPVTGSGEHFIPIRNVAVLKQARGPVEINHLNIRSVVDVYAGVEGRDIGSAAADVQRVVDRLRLPEGYSLHVRGEVASMSESFQSLAFGLVLAIVLLYLLLVAQFRSFVDPLIVMFSVPPGMVGVVLALWMTGTTLNIQSLLGVIMVVGLSVSYSVLMVDQANRYLEQGMAPRAAAIEAARVRFRPILMTSLAAVLGFIPMALRTGEANMPLARAVIGGLLVATAVKLFLIPVLYSYWKRPAPAGTEEIE